MSIILRGHGGTSKINTYGIMGFDIIRLGVIPIRGIAPPDRGPLVYKFACLNISGAFHPGIDAALTPRTGLVTLISG